MEVDLNELLERFWEICMHVANEQDIEVALDLSVVEHLAMAEFHTRLAGAKILAIENTRVQTQD